MTTPYDLVIFDPHCHPEDNFRRFEALGNMIVGEKPRSFIVGGDGSRHDAFSTYDKYKQWTAAEEIAAWKHSLSLMFGPLDDWNTRQSSHRHKQHGMRTLLTLGNHEDRLWSALKENPYGFGSLVDFDSITGKGRYFDEVEPYGAVVNVGGIQYTHAARSVMGRPLALSTLAKRSNTHTIVGHSHTLDVVTTPLCHSENAVRFTMSAPAFMDMGNKEPYCMNYMTGWTYGLLKVYPSGSPTVAPSYEYMSTDRLLKEWL